MKRYEVILSPNAFGQLGDIERWIEEDAGPDVARRYRIAIVAHCHQLENFPDRGRSRDDIRAGLQTIVHRRSVTIAYEVEGNTVVIVAIAGRGREVASALRD